MRWLPAILLLLLIALPFCLGGRADAPPSLPPEDILRIISPHRREARLEYTAAFRDHMRREHGREVDVLWLDPGGGTSAILRDLESRYAANPADPGVDLLFGGGADPYDRSDAKGWLEAVRLPPGLEEALARDCGGIPVRHPQNRWFGVALASFGVIHHQRLLERLGRPVPAKWEDLGHPALRGWVAGGNPALSGAVHACYEIVLQAYGWDRGWPVIAAAAANTRIIGETASVAPNEVASGDAAAGMAIQHYAALAINAADDPALGYTLPAGQTVVSPDGIALLKGSSRRGLAEAFVRFVLSAEGQRLLYRPAGVGGQRFSQNRYPVRPDAYADAYAPKDNPYRNATGVRYSSSLGGRRWEILNDLSTTWLVDPHPELVRAWTAVLARGARPEEAVALFAPPLAEAELLRLADEDSQRTKGLRALKNRRHELAVRGEDATKLDREIAGIEARQADVRLERRRQWSEAALERYRRFAKENPLTF